MPSIYDNLTTFAKRFVAEFGKKQTNKSTQAMSVSSIVSDVARWYEKVRNSMEYHEEEIIIRSAIERILKRRLLFEKKGEIIAEPLIKELLWAQYFQESSVTEEVIEHVGSKINVYLKLHRDVEKKYKINKEELSGWFLDVLSADLARTLRPDHENELFANFMYMILCKKVAIKNDDEEERDIQTFIAVRRSFLKEDKGFLRYNLFKQYFGELNEKNLNHISGDFLKGYKRIEQNWEYPLKNRIFSYIKKQTPPFLILREVFHYNRESLKEILEDDEKFNKEIIETCNRHYKNISAKVRRAIIRSVIFLFFTKVIFAIVVEGSYERFMYGEVHYFPLAINIITPPLLIAAALLFIRAPGEKNTMRIIEIIHSFLTDPDALKIKPLRLDAKQTSPGRWYAFFLALWFVGALITIGLIVYGLSLLNMHIVSQILFVFFMATASFLAYRIKQSANAYKAYEDRQNLFSVFFDLMFMPIVYLGRRFTEGVSKFNVFLMVFDFMIEMPIKSIFAFSEEWLLFLKFQKEKLE